MTRRSLNLWEKLTIKHWQSGRLIVLSACCLILRKNIRKTIAPEKPSKHSKMDTHRGIQDGGYTQGFADAHAAAREVGEDNAARSAAHATGQAVATAHVPTHSLGAAIYALQAVYRATKSPDADAALAKEREWQYRHLLELGRRQVYKQFSTFKLDAAADLRGCLLFEEQRGLRFLGSFLRRASTGGRARQPNGRVNRAYAEVHDDKKESRGSRAAKRAQIEGLVA